MTLPSETIAAATKRRSDTDYGLRLRVYGMLKQGVKVTDIAAAEGLSRQRVYALRDEIKAGKIDHLIGAGV